MTTFTKDPGAILDYKVDWDSWLEPDETLVDAEFTVESGITLHSETFGARSATVWLSGGTLWEDYRVTCRVVTSKSRIDERSFMVKVKNR